MTNDTETKSSSYLLLAEQILDLVSKKKTYQEKEYRQGHDIMMYEIDKEAEEIVKKWVADNISIILIEAMSSKEFLEKFADVAYNAMIVPEGVLSLRDLPFDTVNALDKD